MPAATCDVWSSQCYHHSMKGIQMLPSESSVHSFSSGLLKIKRRGVVLLPCICGIISVSRWYLLLQRSLLLEVLTIIVTAMISYEHKPHIAYLALSNPIITSLTID